MAALNSAETSEQLADILAYPIFTGVITELMAQYLAQIEIEGSFASIEDVNEQLIQEVNQTGALAAIQGLVGNDPDPDLLLELLLLLVEATPDLSELEIYSEAKEYYASQVNLADASFSALELGDLIESINEVDPTVSIVSVEHDGVLNTGDPITFTVQAKNSNGDDVVWFNKMVTGVIDLFGPGLYFYSDFVFENGIAAVSIEIKEARSYELARVFVPKVLGEQEIEFSFTVIPGDMAALRITTSDAHYYPENVPLPYHGQELLLEVTDGYNVLEDYNETHMATVSVEILEIRGFPLLAAKGSQARPVIDGRVLLEFNDGAAEFDIEELMMEQFSEFSFDEVATVAVTVTIADLELSITKEMLLFWGR